MTVDEYIAGLEPGKAGIARALRKAILAAAPSLHEVIKWAEPVYESDGPVCWFKAHSKHVTFGFWRGAALLDMDDCLETSGSKMAHMKLTSVGDVKPSAIAKLVTKAVALNRKLGDPTKRP